MASAFTFSSTSVLPLQNPILFFISSPPISRIRRRTKPLFAGPLRRTRRRPRRKLPDKDMSVAVTIRAPSLSHSQGEDDVPLADSRNGKLFSLHYIYETGILFVFFFQPKKLVKERKILNLEQYLGLRSIVKIIGVGLLGSLIFSL